MLGLPGCPVETVRALVGYDMVDLVLLLLAEVSVGLGEARMRALE